MIVLDSHVWFWWVNLEHQRLPEYMITRIEGEDQVGVSPVSCFELALAEKKDRLALPLPPTEWFHYALEGSNVILLPVSPEITVRAVALTDVHRDPFDRIIIATALELDAQLASLDRLFDGYPELDGRLLGMNP